MLLDTISLRRKSSTYWRDVPLRQAVTSGREKCDFEPLGKLRPEE